MRCWSAVYVCICANSGHSPQSPTGPLGARNRTCAAEATNVG